MACHRVLAVTRLLKLQIIAEADRVLSLGLMEKSGELRKKNAAAKPVKAEFTVIPEDGNEDGDIKARLIARMEAKKAKDFAGADAIREALRAEGIEITDIPGGVRWKRV